MLQPSAFLPPKLSTCPDQPLSLPPSLPFLPCRPSWRPGVLHCQRQRAGCGAASLRGRRGRCRRDCADRAQLWQPLGRGQRGAPVLGRRNRRLWLLLSGAAGGHGGAGGRRYGRHAQPAGRRGGLPRGLAEPGQCSRDPSLRHARRQPRHGRQRACGERGNGHRAARCRLLAGRQRQKQHAATRFPPCRLPPLPPRRWPTTPAPCSRRTWMPSWALLLRRPPPC